LSEKKTETKQNVSKLVSFKFVITWPDCKEEAVWHRKIKILHYFRQIVQPGRVGERERKGQQGKAKG
jgi:hypothetical protein